MSVSKSFEEDFAVTIASEPARKTSDHLLKLLKANAKACALIFGTALFATSTALAENHRSELQEVMGVKHPNEETEGRYPVVTRALKLNRFATPKGFTELLPFMLAAPDQQDAGTCLYMAHTGIAEWWFARLNPDLPRQPDGPTDLSERFLINAAGSDQWSSEENWLTDTIHVFNRAHGALRNVDYRFTKGWYEHDANGRAIRSTEGARNAKYGASYNWINQLSDLRSMKRVRLPKFDREILFADPAGNKWNTGVMPDDIAERIKQALQKNKAPVYVIYNHFGYWHANVIVGFDDDQDNKNCQFVREFLDYNQKQAAKFKADADRASSAAERDRLLAASANAMGVYRKTKSSLDRGGCRTKGMFYVRDSIYSDPSGAVYDYDPSRRGEESRYAEKFTLLEYDWVRTMANHAVQITAKPAPVGTRASEF